MKVGIIGTGNMGSILIEALLKSKSVDETDLNIYNRTLAKAEEIKKQYSNVTLCKSVDEIVSTSNLLFTCMKPKEMHPFYQDIKDKVKPTHCFVSITSPISVEQLETVLSCSTVRFIPSITNKVLSGVTLLTFGANCTEEWKDTIRKIATNISEEIEITNEVTRVSSDIVSCGPAFFSYLAQEFILAATKVTSLDKKTATILTEKMLIGLGDLLKSGDYSLPTLQEKVCVKGGITGEGIKVFEQQLGDVFENVFRATHDKFKEEIEFIEKQFQHPY
ncbi:MULTISPECIES: late competence protein ComER [Bacillus]|uniref:late competence protein ComER n=1 Tax=Bacillus TaxID=1386 RepID=UPI0002FCC37F|nr:MULTISPECIES: late competence protein ComER [Bacillus]